MTLALTLFRRAAPVADDLDTALAGAQIGLERKRRQWLLWLVEEKRAPLQRRLEQTHAAPAGVGPASFPPETAHLTEEADGS